MAGKKRQEQLVPKNEVLDYRYDEAKRKHIPPAGLPAKKSSET